MKTLDLTSKWFIKIQSNQLTISPNFDFSFFKTALDKIMSLNHGTATAKVFWLLYQIWHVIPVNERERILSDILKEDKFYSYFFNWGYDMRNCFYYFYYF